ncbi:MAG: hypothetical protein RSG92_08580, partial [Pseudomonas sp.]
SLSHKHPHELLDSIVKELWLKLFASTEARILRFPQCLSSVYFEVFQNFSFNFNRLTRCDLSSAGGEFYSVSIRCQPPFSPLPIFRSKPLRHYLEHLTR